MYFFVCVVENRTRIFFSVAYVVMACSIETIGDEVLVGEMSLFLNIRDLRVFLTTNRLYSVFPGVRRKLFERYLCPPCTRDVNEDAIRVVLGRLRQVMAMISEMESEKMAPNIVCEINDVCDFFCLLPQCARSALEHFHPCMRDHETLRTHCLDSLQCRLDEYIVHNNNDDDHSKY